MSGYADGALWLVWPWVCVVVAVSVVCRATHPVLGVRGVVVIVLLALLCLGVGGMTAWVLLAGKVPF